MHIINSDSPSIRIVEIVHEPQAVQELRILPMVLAQIEEFLVRRQSYNTDQNTPTLKTEIRRIASTTRTFRIVLQQQMEVT